MRKTFIILGFIFSISAVFLAVLPLFKLAFIPATLAFVCGLIAFAKSKKENTSKTAVQLIFLLTIIALALATFKSVTSTSEVGDTETLEQLDKQSVEDSIDELNELEITE